MLIDDINERIRLVEDNLADIESRLAAAPEGALYVCNERGHVRYYRKPGTDGQSKVYLKSTDDIIGSLAQKQYDARAVEVLKRELSLLRALAELDAPSEIKRIFATIPDNRKGLIEPLEVDDEEYVARWINTTYDTFNIDGSLALSTLRGEKVRSKSEVIIANALFSAGVPYHYEMPLVFSGGKPLHPDFTVLNARTREVFYWEHFGMMDDDQYRHSALRKIDYYATQGQFLGRNLLATFEGTNHLFNTNIVSGIIQEFLL